MDIDLLGILEGLFADAIVEAAPVSALNFVAPELFLLRLHGDGVGDDSRALRALIGGKAVIRPDGNVIRGEMRNGTFTIILPVGKFYIGSAVAASNSKRGWR